MSGNMGVALTAIVLIAAVGLVGAVGAAVIGFATSLLAFRKQQRVGRSFNAVQSGLIGLTGGFCYFAFGGQSPGAIDPGPAGISIRMLAPMVGAAGIMLLVNAMLLGGVLRITTQALLRVAILDVVRAGGLTYIGHGLVAFLFAFLWQIDGLGPVSIVLVVAPLLLAQWSIQQMLAEEDARLRTTRTLVAAVEARHPSIKGTSSAVASIAALIGEERKLRPKQLDALKFAAVLHDIGLVAPALQQSRIDGRLTAADLRQIRSHPDRGVAMIEDIDFLKESVAAIRHHHERWDGRGYPDGLAGSAIPLLARIIAVGDTYVAVRRGRADVTIDETLRILRARSGTHLDPSLVESLGRIADRGRIERKSFGLSQAVAPDHNDPGVSDLITSGHVAVTVR
ncbi:HD-GYP domain-containing protein [Luteipulveratus flavus]|uniref:HD domain-containing phosphohydrolase n=1 Tax=Luteipulveratus flavus TaxID=3031728 RepID=A0ABT6C9T9_9MICO|nr:HD domain-containing phosphohydrolase [Luteipulveratus sp. YIM 133296]MDF8265077.1 HD domain-containing phosphohydrolase [Luteipulveratus sp. YIM 133296]